MQKVSLGTEKVVNKEEASVRIAGLRLVPVDGEIVILIRNTHGSTKNGGYAFGNEPAYANIFQGSVIWIDVRWWALSLSRSVRCAVCR